MTRVLQLESFRRPAPAPAPVFDAADLIAAREEGRAAGSAAARDAAAEALMTAIAGLTAALADDATRRMTLAVAWRQELAQIAAAIATTLAGPLRAEAVAGRVVAALTAELAAGAPQPARIRCEAGAARALAAMLAARGIDGIAVEVLSEGASGAEFALSDGLIRLDPARTEALLHGIIAELDDPEAASTAGIVGAPDGHAAIPLTAPAPTHVADIGAIEEGSRG